MGGVGLENKYASHSLHSKSSCAVGLGQAVLLRCCDLVHGAAVPLTCGSVMLEGLLGQT